MAIDIKPVDPVGRAFFAGVVSGIDLTKPPSPQDVAAVHDGMDKFGVLVFHDQPISDDQQLVFSRALGPLLRTPDEAADTIVWLAAATEARASGGNFFLDRRARAKLRLKRTRRPDERAEAARLWQLCLDACGGS